MTESRLVGQIWLVTRELLPSHYFLVHDHFCLSIAIFEPIKPRSRNVMPMCSASYMVYVCLILKKHLMNIHITVAMMMIVIVQSCIDMHHLQCLGSKAYVIRRERTNLPLVMVAVIIIQAIMQKWKLFLQAKMSMNIVVFGSIRSCIHVWRYELSHQC